MSESENSWVFDCLISFLNGPIWNAPLQNFIEEKSLIFEPDDINTSENEHEYKKIFEDFKNLVDFMLGNFMEDIGITPEQFEEACNRGNYEPVPVHFDQNLFEQIWAANDYEIFKRMMTQRNVELQLQALELIEQKYGITPESFIPKKKQDSKEEVLKSPSLEVHVMEDVVKQFSTEKMDDTEEKEIQYILEEKAILEKKLQEIEEKTVKQPEESHAEQTKPETPKDQSESQPKKETKTPKNTPEKKPKEVKFASVKPIEIPHSSTTEVDSLDLKRRQEYLRMQRDKLVALKKEARKQQFSNQTKTPDKKSSNRPKSAKAAEMVLKGDAEASKVDSKQLLIRKTLAEKLKNEVVGKK